MAKRTEETPLDEALWDKRRTGTWLAGQLGVTVSQVSRWRRGHVVPKPAMRKRIAKLLRVSVSSLWPPEGGS